jgi:hypothetical protein
MDQINEYPDLIILDTLKLIKDFDNVLNSLSFSNDFAGHDFVPAIFDYITDLADANTCLEEYVSEIIILYAYTEQSEEVKKLGDAIHTLGDAFIAKLKHIEAYDKDGICWYAFKKYINNDISLIRFKRFELVN